MFKMPKAPEPSTTRSADEQFEELKNSTIKFITRLVKHRNVVTMVSRNLDLKTKDATSEVKGAKFVTRPFTWFGARGHVLITRRPMPPNTSQCKTARSRRTFQPHLASQPLACYVHCREEVYKRKNKQSDYRVKS